ncbi:MAG TPA: branched-chain amino acid ABC transporter permease [Dehalococcoidia bacterium]|nr:branched-chain amino acid ABC transporter permease [Dehalococcoidia bacterium]
MVNILSRAQLMRYGAYVLVGLAVFLIVPQFIASYYVLIWAEILIYAIFALSFNMLMGYTGLLSLGHAAFFGAGGYTVALLVVKGGMDNFWLCIFIALLVSALLGLVFGYLALRTTGIYFIIITLALAQMLWALAWRWRSLTGGDDGLPGIDRPDFGLPWSLEDTTNYYYFILVFFVLSLFILYRISRSPFGRTLVGIRENEPRMQALGYNTWRYKYVCFIIAAVFGGLAGVLKVYQDGFISPTYCSMMTSALVVLMALIGGTRVFTGPILGAGVVWIIKSVVSSYTEYWTLILGILMVVIVMFAPQGIVGYLAQLKERYGTLKG